MARFLCSFRRTNMWADLGVTLSQGGKLGLVQEWPGSSVAFPAQTCGLILVLPYCRVVGKALSRNGLIGQHHPRDYLNFYCLGNRQDTVGPRGEAASQPRKCGRSKPRRSFIHVHAKVRDPLWLSQPFLHTWWFSIL